MARIASTTTYNSPNRATLAALRARQDELAAQGEEITKPRTIASPWQGFAQLAQQFVNQRQAGQANEAEAAGRSELAQAMAKYYQSGEASPEEMATIMERDPDIGAKIAAEGLRRRQEMEALQEQRKYTEGRDAFEFNRQTGQEEKVDLREVGQEEARHARDAKEAADLANLERVQKLTDEQTRRKQELDDAALKRKQEVADTELGRVRTLTDAKTEAERDAAKVAAANAFKLGPEHDQARSDKSADAILAAQQKAIDTSVAEENKVADAKRTPGSPIAKLAQDLKNNIITQEQYDIGVKDIQATGAAKAPEMSRPASADDRKNWNLDKSGNYKMVSKDGGQNWSPVGVGGGGAGDKLMTPEAAARIGLANEYLKNSDNVRTSAAAGEMTGPIDYQTSVRLGKGNGGVAFRQLKQGTEAYVRMMTGAGMAISEAQEKAMQYEPQWTDTAEVLTSKVDGLNAALKAIIAEATLGRQTTTGDQQQPEQQQQEQAQPSTPAPAGVDQALWDEMTPEEKAAFQ